MRKFLTVAMTLALGLFVATSAFAVAIDLGDASKYNAFIKNDFKVTSSDTEGRIAVGGDFIVNGGYDVGAEITYLGMGEGPSLVVGGDIVKGNNQWGGSGFLNVYENHPSELGDIVHAGDVIDNGSSGGILGNLNKVNANDLPVDFDSAFAHLNKLSTDLMAATTHGDAVRDGNRAGAPLVFTPTSTPSDNVYVFNVTQEQLNANTDWFVEGVSDDATILFNITNPNNIAGKSNNQGGQCSQGQVGCVHFSQSNLSINGVLASSHLAGKGGYKDSTMTNNILYNFGDASQVNLASDLYGSVLAPNADIKANPSVIWGQVIGKSWEGNMQINYNPFTPVGSTPPTPVPTPATLWVFALALALLYVNRKSFIRVKRKPFAE
ncbi:choice-of-anchor A family protein [Colwellia sp. D2M02]|uniref:choice-of-anchor A family protein n=1 Tax=Colwellia sp. D2M02 TaxID=2841562 RepID=UPI001C0A52C4|nr:choice-of-anchor A family protein [Colwellia sp. D2M02]MBU2892268.1 choice-of-anchor A family protein [Colwellia sp. D2M02]